MSCLLWSANACNNAMISSIWGLAIPSEQRRWHWKSAKTTKYIIAKITTHIINHNIVIKVTWRTVNRTSFFFTASNSGCQNKIAIIPYKTLILKVVWKHKWHRENRFIYVLVQEDHCFVLCVFPCFQVQKIRKWILFH